MENQKESLFKYLKYAVIVITILAIYCALWGPWAKYGDSLYPARTFNVQAEGKMVTKPTLAKVSLAVVSEGSNPGTVQENNTKTMNKVIDYVKGQGVVEDDIKTSGYNLSPKYSYPERGYQSFINGYSLTQTVEIKVKDLEKVGTIIGGLGSMGINQINSVIFDVTDEEREALMKEARIEAFKKAEEKARAVAEASGIGLGGVVSFSEGFYPEPYYAKESSIGVAGAGYGGDLSPSLEPGSQEIVVNVNVVYRIK